MTHNRIVMTMIIVMTSQFDCSIECLVSVFILHSWLMFYDAL